MRNAVLITLLCAACSGGRSVVARPGDTGPDDADFELDVPSYALQGPIYGEPWGPASDAFAIADGAGGYEIFVGPFPLSACDEDERLRRDVLYASIPALEEAGWSEGGEVSLGIDGGLLTTQGGGYDLALDVTETKVVGGLLFDVDPSTRLQGQIEAPLCQ